MAVNYCNQEIKGTLTTTGTITSGGSVTIPDYIIHAGDADTKIGFNTNDNVEIRVGGNLQISASSSRAYLRYQGSNKIQTDSTGVNITGGATTTASSTFAGANVTADFAWSDSIKATFGASNDLEIYHDGSNSYIDQTGTGDLILRTSSSGDDVFIRAMDDVFIQPKNGEAGVYVYSDGAVELYYNGSKKFETTVNGIQLTNTEGTQIRFVESDSTYTESMRIIRYQDVLGFHYGDNASEEAFTIDNTGEATAHKNLTVSGGNITLSGTGRIQGIDTVSSGTDAANKTYVDNAVSGAGSGTFLPLAGGTMTGNIVMGDNDITGIDQLIFSSGTYLTDNSTNYLQLNYASGGAGGILILDGDGSTQGYLYADGQATSGFGLLDGSGSWAVRCIEDQYVELRYDNSIKFKTSNTGVNITGNADVSGDVLVGGADSYFAENNLRFKPAGAAYIDHNTTGQSLVFRTSNSSSLDTSALTITSDGYATFVNGISATNTSFSGTVNIASPIYHIGDTNTYFGFNTADSIQLVTGGGQRLLANNNGVKIGGGATVTTILDEDNMSSDSATALATQQSIKAYVDSSTTGVLTYQGTWNADTNSPTLSSGSGTPGYYFIVSTAGTTDLDGITDWQVGDWAVFSDQATDAWQKIDNTQVGNISGSGVSSRVTYWNGTGSVTSTAGFTFDGSNLAIPGYLTISGNQIVSPSNFTIDVGGDITLDADGSDIILSDGGTIFGKFASDSNNLNIFSQQQDKDIVFRGNDGGSGITALTLDMSDAGAAIFNQALYIPHYIYHTGDTNTYFGFSNDDTWRITTGGSTAITVYNNSIVTTGDFTVGDELTITTIGNATADPDKFLCASGANKVGYRTGAQVLSDIGAASSSSLGSYLPLAGGTMTGNVIFNDSVKALFGTGSDMELFHNGSQAYIDSYTGELNFTQHVNDGYMRFKCDDGSGGTATYMFLDGSNERVTFNKDIRIIDSEKLQLGSSGDLNIFHNGTNSYLENDTGDLYIRNNFIDRDIILQSDDGNGGIATYIQVDGSATQTLVHKTMTWLDSVQARFGSGGDLHVYHNGSNSYIENYTGSLVISNTVDDGDIMFFCDDGSGGTTAYLTLDGSATNMTSHKDINWIDSAKAKFGNSGDMSIYHDSSNSYLTNLTGHLYIMQRANDADISFQCDDGSGGDAEYFRLDGSGQYLLVSAALGMYFNDGIAARFGNSGDLIAYHDGSNSYITNATGDLYIQGNGDDVVIQGADDVQIKVQGGEVAANFGGNGGVDLYHNNSVKFNTTANGIEVTGKTDTDTLLIGTSTEVDAILDEDNMASNSATSLATQQSIKAYVDAISVPTVNNSTITLTAGTGLTGSSSFTLNQASNQTITFSLSVNSLSTSTTAGDADFFIVGTTMGAEYKMAPANIALSHFNNDSGWTTNTGTVTSVSVGTGLDISNSTTTPSITMDLTELTLGSGLDATATGLSLDFSEFVSATADEVTSFIVYNSGDTQPERLLVSNVHDIDAYWKYTPVIFNGSFNDGTSSTSTFYIPIAGSTSETTSSQEYQFAAMPFAGRVRTLMMQNTGTTPTTTNSTRFKIYKNGSLAYTSSYQVPTNGGSVGAYIKFDNINETFSVGDRIQFAYNKQFTSDYWRDVAFTAVVEFQQM